MCIRKNSGTDIAAIHNNVFVFTHPLLLGHHRLADGPDSANLTHVIRYVHLPDFIRYVLAIQRYTGISRLDMEIDMDLIYRSSHFSSLAYRHRVADKVQGHRPVHRTAVNVQVM